MIKPTYRLKKPIPGEMKGDIFKFVPMKDWYINVSFKERQIEAGETVDVISVYKKEVVENNPDWFEPAEKKTYDRDEVKELIRLAVEFNVTVSAAGEEADDFMKVLDEKGLF